MVQNKQLFYTGTVLSVIFALIYVFFINDISFPWRDELCFTDAPANLSQKGLMSSHVWRYCAPPFHSVLLTAWLYIFGVSHMAVASFTVATGLLTFVLLLRILIKRGLVTNTIVASIFAVLFWGGYTFSWLLTNGRIDLLVMLLTLLFVNEVIPFQGKFYSQSRWPSLLYAFLIMATYIYTIPITCVFCFVLLFVIKDKNYRKELIIRYIWIVVALIASFVLTCLFLASQHSLFRYLNALVSFNATVNAGDETPSLVTRIIEAYSIDLFALILLLASYVLLLFKVGLKGLKEYWFPLLFVTAIPLLMVFSGRYKVYYSCVFYIPVLVLFVWSLDKYKTKVLLTTILLLAIVSAISTPIIQKDYYMDNREQMIRSSNFINENAQYFKIGENVVFNNSKLYYFLFDQDVVLWQKYKGLQEIESPEEKFIKFVNKKIKSPETRNKVLDIFRQVEAPDPYLPEEGLIIAEGIESVSRVKDYMTKHSITLEKLTESYGFTLYKFNK